MSRSESSDHSTNSKLDEVAQEQPKKLSIFQFLKRSMVWRRMNTQRGGLTPGNKDLDSSARQLTLADFELPDQEICEHCKVSKESCTFEELQLLQETCDRRKNDGNQCIVPVLVSQRDELSMALERELAKVVPTAQLRERVARYILVRCDAEKESSGQPIYAQVRYDSVSRSPSISIPSSLSRSQQSVASYGGTPSIEMVDSRARSRSASRSQSPGRDRGRPTVQVGGSQVKTSNAGAGGGGVKLK